MWTNRYIKDNRYALIPPVHFVAKDGAARQRNSSHPYFGARFSNSMAPMPAMLMLSARSSLYPFVRKDSAEGIVRKETSYYASGMMTDTL